MKGKMIKSLKITVKEMVEEEIWKISFGEDNSSQKVRPSPY